MTTIWQAIRGVLANAGGAVSQPLLVAAVHAETDAAAWIIRVTLERKRTAGRLDSTPSGWELPMEVDA